VDGFTNNLVLAAAKDSGGSFLVSPGLGLMIWTLIAFGSTFLILRKYAYPLISDALEKRRRQIEESIEYAEKMRAEADKLLEEYRARLKEAREQADDILVRSRKAAEAYEQEVKEKSRHEHQEALERTRRELRHQVEQALRKGAVSANGSAEAGLSDAQIALCLEYASEDAPIDFDKLFPASAASARKTEGKEP